MTETMAIPNVLVGEDQLDRMLENVGELWSDIDEVRQFLSIAFRSSEVDRVIELLRANETVSVTVNGTMITIRRDVEVVGVTLDRKWTAVTSDYLRWQKANIAYLETGLPQYAKFSSELLKAGHEVLVERDPDHGLLAVGWRHGNERMEPAPRTAEPFVTTVTKVYLAPDDDDDRSMYFDTQHGTVHLDGPMSVALHIRLDRPAHRQREG